MDRQDRIFVAGHLGMLGRAVVRSLRHEGFSNVVTATKNELNLLDQSAVHSYFRQGEFQHVIIAAARVGGIQFNIDNPVTLGHENGMITLNLLDACHRTGVERVMFPGSSCIYPRACRQPMQEDDLLSGPLEPTNEMYALAKIFGLRMIDAYRKQFGHRWVSCQPCNLYGPFDSFDPKNSHFIAALMRKLHTARIQKTGRVECWGTGNARREVLHVDDAASAMLFLMKEYDGPFVNVGCGVDHSIREMTEMIADVVGFDGQLEWNADRPEGMPRKLLDTSRITELGWAPQIELKTGLKQTYNWWLQNGGCNEISVSNRLVG